MILLRARDFRLIWTGQVVSVVGDGMQRIALLWWARRSGGNGLLAAVALATMLPLIAGSPVGGWMADRLDRRRLMVAADLARLGLTAALATLMLSRHASPVVVCALVALCALATSVFEPTYAAAVPTLIEPDDRPAANGMNMANSAVGGLIGPLVGGVLIASFSVGTVLTINAITFAWSAAFVAMSRVPRPAGATAEAKERHSTRAAVAAVLRDCGLRRLVGLAATLNMVVAPVPLLIVALAVDRFHTGSVGLGVLQVTISAGILIGALAASKLARTTIARPMLVLGVCFALVGSLTFVAAAAVFVVGGIAIAVANTVLLTRFQSSVAEEIQGRVFGAVGAIGEALRPVGLALGAPLLAVAGVSGAFIAVGASVIVATLFWGLTPATPAPTTPDSQQVSVPV